jgi:hypothetical protein
VYLQTKISNIINQDVTDHARGLQSGVLKVCDWSYIILIIHPEMSTAHRLLLTFVSSANNTLSVSSFL